VRSVALALLLTLGAFGLLLFVVLPAGGAPLLAKPLHEQLPNRWIISSSNTKRQSPVA